MNSTSTSARTLVLGLVTVAACGKDLDVGDVPVDSTTEAEEPGSSDDGVSSEGPGTTTDATTTDATTGDPSPMVSPPCEFATAGAALDPTQWGVVCGGTGHELVTAIAIAADGSIYTLTQVEGFGNTVLFGDEEVTTGDSPSLVFTKLTQGGAIEWSHAWSGVENWWYGASIAACDDRVFITASHADHDDEAIDVGTGPLQGNLLLAAFDDDGAAQWAMAVGQNDDNSSGYPDAAVRCRDGGGLLVAGEATNGFELGGQTVLGAPLLGSVVFVVALDADGAGQWATQSDAFEVWATPTSDGGAVAAVVTNEGEPSLARYDDVGAVLWQQSFPTVGGAFVSGLEVDDDGAVSLAGVFAGEIDLGAGPLVNANPAVPDPNDPFDPMLPVNDGFVARYDATGTYAWAAHFDAPGSDRPTLVTLDAAGAPIVMFTVDGEFSLVRVDDGDVTSAGVLPAPWMAELAGHPGGGLAIAYTDPTALPPFEAPLTARGGNDYAIVRVVP